MPVQVAIVYNQPSTNHSRHLGEEKAIEGVLEAVLAVEQALLSLGHNVTSTPLHEPASSIREQVNSLKAKVFFNLFEGFDGYPETEALVATILAEQGIPQTGCPGSALTLALDKYRSRAVLESAGIETPKAQLLSTHTLPSFNLSYPCIIKPCRADASHGLCEESVVYNSYELEKQILWVCTHYGGNALVEEYIEGREFNVTVMGYTELTVLPISEIVYSLPEGMPKILTFAAKWDPQSMYYQHTNAICPATIDADLRKKIETIALAAFRALGCRGYARVDFRMDSQQRLKVIDINPNPDIAPDSGAARQARASGMTYEQFIEKILQLGLER